MSPFCQGEEGEHSAPSRVYGEDVRGTLHPRGATGRIEKTARHGLEEQTEDLGMVFREPPKLPPRQHHDGRRFQRHHIGGTGSAIEQRELSEKLARAEAGQRLPVFSHLHLALEDDVEPDPLLALGYDHRILGDIADLGERGEPFELPVRETRKERGSLQPGNNGLDITLGCGGHDAPNVPEDKDLTRATPPSPPFLRLDLRAG